jgi:hypothetical protein
MKIWAIFASETFLDFSGVNRFIFQDAATGVKTKNPNYLILNK